MNITCAFRMRFIGILGTAGIACMGMIRPASAQQITLSGVQNTGSSYFQPYRFTQHGQTINFEYYNFTFGVSSGTGLGASLAGGDYMGFCLSGFFSDPGDGYVYSVGTDATALSYSINGSGDFWLSHRQEKFDALTDVLAAFAPDFVGTPMASQEFADMVSAFNFLSTEIVLDYDGTLGSLDLSSGENLVRNTDGSPVTGAVLDLYTDMVAEIGSGAGAGMTFYAAHPVWTGVQDLVFFDIHSVPEPGAALLAACVLPWWASRRSRSMARSL